MEKEKESVVRGTITLLLVDGSIVELSYPADEIFEEVYEELVTAIEHGKLWNVGNWVEWKAKWNGWRLETLNCSMVVGTF